MSRFLASVKSRASIFTLNSVCDNKGEMASVSQASPTEHPLLVDRKRLDKILDVMYAKIHK